MSPGTVLVADWRRTELGVGDPLVRNRRPGRVGVIQLHSPELLERLGAEVLLVDDSAVAYDEGFHAGHQVFGGCGYQGKAAYHRSLNYEVQLPDRRRWALT